MRISDWSSDVCSSDLDLADRDADDVGRAVLAAPGGDHVTGAGHDRVVHQLEVEPRLAVQDAAAGEEAHLHARGQAGTDDRVRIEHQHDGGGGAGHAHHAADQSVVVDHGHVDRKSVV